MAIRRSLPCLLYSDCEPLSRTPDTPVVATVGKLLLMNDVGLAIILIGATVGLWVGRAFVLVSSPGRLVETTEFCTVLIVCAEACPQYRQDFAQNLGMFRDQSPSPVQYPRWLQRLHCAHTSTQAVVGEEEGFGVAMA